MPFCFRTTPTQLYSLDSNSLYSDRHSPELGIILYSDSQPLTPEEQFVVMLQHEEEIHKQEQSPSESDTEVLTFLS